MQRIVRKRIRHQADGIDLVADVQAAISVNSHRSGPDEGSGGDGGEQHADAQSGDRPPPKEKDGQHD